MATNSVPGAFDQHPTASSAVGDLVTGRSPNLSLTDSTHSWGNQLKLFLTAVLTPLASLKLTVGLLGVSVFVVWVATLEQTRYDIWTVKQLHFPNWFVRIPLQTFFPPAWFPNFQQLPGSIYLPSGFLLIVAMLINLIAAHILRMRIQARGTRLAVGGIGFIVAALVTWAVIFNGQNADGFQVQPPISYKQMWLLMQIALWGIVIVSSVSAFRLDPARQLERTLLTAAAVMITIILAAVMLFGENSFIGDSAMRVLWQLVQASVAGIAALVASILVFKHKAGMVVIHLGIAMLLVNEIYVSTTNEEQQMIIGEGDKTAHTVDIRSIEMVIADTTQSDANRLLTIPKQKLLGNQRIDHPELPFIVEVLALYPNAEIVAAENASGLKATQGIGLRFAANSIPVSTGTETDARPDQAAAYVQLYSRQSNEPLGIWMLSQVVFDNGFIDEVAVDGKSYKIGLRYKHIYKPYTVQLIDAQRENYLGTATPKWFASEFLLTDESQNVNGLRQVVSMNNPLRYRDETFYQSRHWTQESPAGKRDFTALQIVKNKGWMIPYVACMYVVVGLFAQFGSSLVAFLEKRRKVASPVGASLSVDRPLSQQNKSTIPQPAATAVPVARRNWLPIALLVLAIVYAGSAAGRAFAPVEREQIRLDRWGKLPVTFGGRVQPLDSLARNLARQLGNRETVLDQFQKSQPAIRWLADLVYESPGFDEYAVMRIDDLNVLSSLNLPVKKGFKYSLKEIEQVQPTLDGLIAQFAETPEKSWNNTQKRLQDVRSKLNMIFAVRLALGNPAQRVTGDDIFAQLEVVQRVSGSTQVPLSIPQEDSTAPWTTLPRAYAQKLVNQQAAKYSVTTLTDLARVMTDREVIEPAREQMIRMAVVDELLKDKTVVDMLLKNLKEESISSLRERMLNGWDALPKEVYQPMLPRLTNSVDTSIAMRIQELYDSTEKILRDSLGATGNALPPEPNEVAKQWMQLEGAYREKNAAQFNEAVASAQAEIKRLQPEGHNTSRLSSESFYNGFSPFYVATVLYLFAAGLSVFSWIRWPQVLNQAATWVLLFAVGIHVLGIVLRIAISQRAPVTNLYSSFVFVSAAAVVLMMVVERMTKLGIGNLLAGIIGSVALLWAWSISISDGDTFTVLQAVLDTQFWLSTHVIVISLGYSATVAAGFMGIAFLFRSLLSRNFQGDARRLWVDQIYGITCFALLCSFFGTVLGGLWADDSWGRFWGWDPKENGALMIVLWNAVLLHARWAGLVKQTGIAVLAILGNVVTIWSWEGVNQLGQGLHSYGFSEDRLFWVGVFAVVNLLIATLAVLPASWHRSQSQRLA